jgi:hypothetical protein
MTAPKTDEQKAVAQKRRNWIAIGSAIVVAATPGAYNAWSAAKEAAKAAARVGVEVKTRDRQEADLQRWVKANAEAIAEIKRSMVTHRELLDLALRLREVSQSPRRRPTAAAGAPLAASVDRLREKAKLEEAARQRAAQALKERPPLKSAGQIRQQVKQESAAQF